MVATAGVKPSLLVCCGAPVQLLGCITSCCCCLPQEAPCKTLKPAWTQSCSTATACCPQLWRPCWGALISRSTPVTCWRQGLLAGQSRGSPAQAMAGMMGPRCVMQQTIPYCVSLTSPTVPAKLLPAASPSTSAPFSVTSVQTRPGMRRWPDVCQAADSQCCSALIFTPVCQSCVRRAPPRTAQREEGGIGCR